MKNNNSKLSRKIVFCALCGRHHEPHTVCGIDMAGDTLRELGVEEPRKTSASSFRKLTRTTDRIMIVIVALFVLIIIVIGILRRMYR
jgi:hypothetical protein